MDDVTVHGYAVGSHAARPRPEAAVVMLGPHRPDGPTRPVLVLAACAALGLGVGLFSGRAGIVLAVMALLLLLRRLEVTALLVVGLAPLQAPLGTFLPTAPSWPTTTLAVTGLLLLGWAEAVRQRRLWHTASARRVTALLVGVALLLAVLGLLRPGARDGTAALDAVAQAAPVLVAVVVLAAVRGRTSLRRVATVHVAGTLGAAVLVVLAVLVGDAARLADAERLVPWAVSALPLLVALTGRRHPLAAAGGAVVVLGAVLLEVALGVASPVVLLALGAMLLVAGATGQLAVRSLVASVAVALLAVGAVPVLSGAGRAGGASFADGLVSDELVTPAGPQVVLALVALAVALVTAWPVWREARAPLAGAVVTALVGTGTTTALSGGLETLPLWLLVAFAGALARPAPGAGEVLDLGTAAGPAPRRLRRAPSSAPSSAGA